MKILPTLGSMMSGSLRGLTASHNKGGLYLRGRTVPTNPNTARQQVARSTIGYLMQTWDQELTDVQRQGWRSYAENVPVTDTLGQPMTLSGVNHFVRSNSARAQALMITGGGPARVDDAPVIFNTGAPPVDVVLFEGDFTTPPGSLDLTVDIGPETSAAGFLFVYIAPPQNAGVRFYKGPYQLAAIFSFTAATAQLVMTFDLDPANLDWFSDIVPLPAWDGLNVPLRLVAAYNDGRVSQQWRSLVEFTDGT
jgi:hypothetical protein